MGRKVSVFVFMMLSLSLLIGGVRFFVTPGKATTLPSAYPLVYVYPDNLTLSVNETFTVSVIVYNLTHAYVEDPYRTLTQIPLGNLYAFDVQLSWDPTIIHCTDHTVTTPVESYPTPIPPSPYAGILHGFGEPENTTLFTIKNIVNESGNIKDAFNPSVRAWFSYATGTPATPFNGNGTICTLTFKILKKGQSSLKIEYALLSDDVGIPIGYSLAKAAWLNSPRSGTVKTVGAPSIKSVSYSPSIGVVNKPVHFSAVVTGNDTSIANCMWDFGDKTGVENTTTPTADHNYTSSDIYYPSLKVVDVDGAESANFTVTEGVMIAASRDLKVASITLSQSIIRPNRILSVSTLVDNLDKAGFTFYENCTLRLYYNASSLDESTAWVEVGTGQNASIGKGGFKQASFSLNSSSLPKLEAYYYFELNVTGIPSAYEANTTNNVKVSDALLYTNATIRQVSIDTFAFGYKSTSTSTPTLPVIKGEYTNVTIVVRNAGNDYDQFNVTFYVNSTLTATWETSVLGADKTQTFNWGSKDFDAGYYNLTAVAIGGNVSSPPKYGILTVIKTPSLAIDYSPQSPAVGQEVTVNGSRSRDQDPRGNITNYSWKIFAPGVPTVGTPYATFSGSNLTVISFVFNDSGEWTVLLTVTDNVAGYVMTYDKLRSAASAYQTEVVITVAGVSGLPIELVIGIVVVVAVVVIAAVILLRRRRGPKPNV